MFKLRRLLAVLIIVSCLVLSVVLWRSLQQGPEEILEVLPPQVDLALNQLHYTQNENGRKSWTLDADRAEYQRENKQGLLDNVRMTLYDTEHFGEIQLQAEHGRLKQDSRQVEVWGQVKVRSDRQQYFYTDRLLYDDSSRRLLTEEAIRLLTPRMELSGTGMQVNIETGHLQIKKDVWMMLLPDEQKGTYP